MTNPTPPGQVPEALRLADALERPGYGWHTTPAQCAAVLRRLHAENEALRTQQPAPDGAPPGAYVNGAGIKADDRPATVIRKLNARFHDLVTFPRAEKFSASPTPPVEQQTQPGAVYAELHEPDATTVGLGAVWNRHSMRDFADRTHALRMQAAPKAAPAQQAGEAAESVPAREHDLQDVRCECCGYMTYHREHMGCIHAARAPADSVQEDAAWMPLTPELLTAIESGDLGNRFWIAAHNSNEPQIGVYEWQQGRNPHGFNSDLSRYGASEITHVLPYKPPALPAASSPQSKEKSNDR